MPEYRFEERGHWQKYLGKSVYTELEREMKAGVFTKLHGEKWQSVVRKRGLNEHEKRYLASHFSRFFSGLEQEMQHEELRTRKVVSNVFLKKKLREFVSRGPLSSSENSQRVTELTRLLAKRPPRMEDWHEPTLQLFLDKAYAERLDAADQDLLSLIKSHIAGGGRAINWKDIDLKIRKQAAKAAPDEQKRWLEIQKRFAAERQAVAEEAEARPEGAERVERPGGKKATFRERMKAFGKAVTKKFRKKEAAEEGAKGEGKEEEKRTVVKPQIRVTTFTPVVKEGGAGGAAEGEWWMRNVSAWGMVIAAAAILLILMMTVFK